MRLRSWILPAVAVTAVGAGAAAAPALAAHPATKAQTRSLARAMDLPARCITATIADGDRDWAKTRPSDDDSEGCLRASGAVVLNRGEGGPWRMILQAADDPTARCIGARQRIPLEIIRDLRVCRVS